MAFWYYVLNGQSQGPVPETEIKSLQQRKIITPDTPVWTEGMGEWVPLQRSALVAVASSAGVSIGMHSCAECGKRFPEDDMLQYENKWVCAACKPVFFQRIREGVTPETLLIYAGIWPRFTALLIDGIIILMIVIVPEFLLIGSWQGFLHLSQMSLEAHLILYMLSYGIPVLYETFFIGKYGATPGKMLLRVKVVTPDGKSISYLRALGRHFAKLLSRIILYIGFIMAFWDEEKRALHDRICKTRVIVDQPA